MKHLVDIDEQALSDARATLGTMTIKDTVNAALRRVADEDDRAAVVDDALAALTDLSLSDAERQGAWS